MILFWGEIDEILHPADLLLHMYTTAMAGADQSQEPAGDGDLGHHLLSHVHYLQEAGIAGTPVGHLDTGVLRHHYAKRLP